MPKYEVIHDFTDLQDDDKVYFKGDLFPDPVNKRIKKERINELLSKKNKQGRAVIKEIKE